MKRRVVVTGMGAITPIGNGVEAFWEGIRQERIGFGLITKFDAGGYRCSLAAEVKDFEPERYMDKKAARRMELFCQYAVAAAGEALADAALDFWLTAGRYTQMPRWIWKRKTPAEWDALWAAAWEAYRLWSGNAPGCLKKARPE